MAYVAVIVTVAEMQFMAGEKVDSTGDAEANHTVLQDYAEAYLSLLVNYDITTNWATINAIYKLMFTEWAARNAGIALISYNMGGYTTILEAEDMINIHLFRMQQIEKLLVNSTIRDLITGA